MIFLPVIICYSSSLLNFSILFTTVFIGSTIRATKLFFTRTKRQNNDYKYDYFFHDSGFRKLNYI